MSKIMVGHNKNVTIYDNDRCPHGLRYLEDLSPGRLDELLTAADREPDRNFHFTSVVNGREVEFAIIRRANNEYEVAPGSY